MRVHSHVLWLVTDHISCPGRAGRGSVGVCDLRVACGLIFILYKSSSKVKVKVQSCRMKNIPFGNGCML